jgi:hypothetical protein
MSKEGNDARPSAPARRKGRLELTRGIENSRVFMHLLMNFLHRADHERRTLYKGDLELAAVGETVGMVVIEPLTRTPEFLEQFSDYRVPVGLAAQQSVNAMTISDSTGIPRETVRRRLKQLIARGVLTERGRGAYVYTPGFIQQPENIELVDRGMRYTLQFMNDCVRLGLIRWVDDAE